MRPKELVGQFWAPERGLRPSDIPARLLNKMKVMGALSKNLLAPAAVLVMAGFALAENSSFDLAGPAIDVRVNRAGRTLPIARVPNLRPGDRLWLHPVLPTGESVHYLMIASFLRGSTNPPPDAWFKRMETWRKQIREEGIGITIPEGAQQVLLFLAPETTGDARTLRSAVQGRPGAFVRASQDLNQASLDRTRLDEYLAAVRATAKTDPAELHKRSVLLARSLGIKLDEQCFDKATEQQAPCLMKDTSQLVLEDGHAQSMVAALTSGAASDLIEQLSLTPPAHSGYYSPYVGAFMDVARLMDSIRTAEYQYLPALALPHKDELDLKLNSAPSFHKPQSVLVAALPAVGDAEFPPVRPVDPKQVVCFDKASALLPAEGAPLMFSTSFGHDLVLHVQAASGKTFDLPAKAEGARGGFSVDTHTLNFVPESDITGTLRGQWGFDAWNGPVYHLHLARSGKWVVLPSDQSALVVGREDTLHLDSPDAACVDDVTVDDQSGEKIESTWKRTKPTRLELKISLKDAKPGPLAVLLKQDDAPKPDELRLHAYAEAGHLDRFVIGKGERVGLLEGTRLDEVASLEWQGVRFVPGEVTRVGEKDELRVSAPGDAAIPLLANNAVAQVSLKDGRVLSLAATVGPPEPKVTLISRSVRPGQSAASSARPSAAIHLASAEELPQNASLVFFLKSEVPEGFPRTEKIEVAGPDDSFHVLLSVADGNLILQDARTVMAMLDPGKSFGPSAFGPLRFRPVGAPGSWGEWQPLATLVRLPNLTDVHCPDSPDRQCTLSGTDLFLIHSVSADPQFLHAVSVPEGFADSTLSVPRPDGTLLYIKLRDDPSVISTATLPVLPE
jgi:hypothetical protein